MTLEDAITILIQYSKAPEGVSLEDERDSIQLGIQALKQYKQMKEMGEISDTYLLPGETISSPSAP